MTILAPTFATLIGAGICLLAFGSVYERWMHRESFYQANRLYLLLTPFLALLIPHLQLDVLLSQSIPAVQLLEKTQSLSIIWLRGRLGGGNQAAFTLGKLLLGIYFFGVAITLGKSLIGFGRILSWIRQGKVTAMDNWHWVSQAKAPETASFFKYIFWNQDLPIPPMVLQHELIHVRQGHSWDVVLMETWVALYWFNPFIYRLRQRLQETHEFIADAGVIETEGSAYAYACLLTSQQQKPTQMLYNTFAAQLRSRLLRMTQQASPRWKVLQFAVCLPLILSLGMFFSVNFLQALPIDNDQQSLQQVIKKWEQTPVIATTTTTGLISTPEKTHQTLHSAGMMTLAALPQDTTSPQTIVVTSSDKSGNAIDIKGKNAKMLVIVDGKKVGTMGNGGEAVISNMNADNISTVTVLKGESATAVYGAEGQDGVVIVNTKTDSDDKMVVKVNSSADVSFTVSSHNSADGVGTSSSFSTTSSGSRPLIVIDGKIIGRMEAADKESPLNKMNPDDIDSINVLKGEKATKKYGADGENGVIEVILKKRKK